MKSRDYSTHPAMGSSVGLKAHIPPNASLLPCCMLHNKEPQKQITR